VLGAYCDRLDREVLIWYSSIIAVDNTAEGILLTCQCACGEVAQMLTGARVAAEKTSHLAA
jgi:hypothetical protein